MLDWRNWRPKFVFNDPVDELRNCEVNAVLREPVEEARKMFLKALAREPVEDRSAVPHTRFPFPSVSIVSQLLSEVAVSADPESVPRTSSAVFGLAVATPTRLFVPSYTRPFVSITRRFPVEFPAVFVIVREPESVAFPLNVEVPFTTNVPEEKRELFAYSADPEIVVTFTNDPVSVEFTVTSPPAVRESPCPKP